MKIRNKNIFFLALFSILSLSIVGTSIYLENSQLESRSKAADTYCPDGGRHVTREGAFDYDSCDYGKYDEHGFEVNSCLVDKGDPDNCSKCIRVLYHTGYPWGVCKFSGEAPCRRGDFTGGCAGTCNSECCGEVIMSGEEYDAKNPPGSGAGCYNEPPEYEEEPTEVPQPTLTKKPKPTATPLPPSPTYGPSPTRYVPPFQDPEETIIPNQPDYGGQLSPTQPANPPAANSSQNPPQNYHTPVLGPTNPAINRPNTFVRPTEDTGNFPDNRMNAGGTTERQSSEPTTAPTTPTPFISIRKTVEKSTDFIRKLYNTLWQLSLTILP